jgi:cell wall-associated NlpC family hydrolase
VESVPEVRKRRARWLAAGALGLALVIGAPATAVAVPPPPPNPSDEELDSSRWKARKRAGEVGQLTNRLAWAETRLTKLRSEVARKQELANKARVDAQTAQGEAKQAKLDAATARQESTSASWAVKRAEKAKDRFVAGSYRQGSTMGSLSAYLTADNAADVLERSQVLDAVGDRQLNAIEDLKQARIGKANADAAARKSLQVAQAKQRAAERAEQAAEVAYDTAIEARQTQAARTQDLEAEKEEVAHALWEAQRKVSGLEGQRERYEEWKAAKEREEALEAQQAALNAGGSGGGGPSGSSAPAGATVEAAISRAMSQIGVPYAWGGGNANGPTYGIRDGGVADSFGDYNKIGFDCSGLMIYAFAGVKSLPHYSGYQYNSGRHVPLSQARRGDMLFWGNGGIHHVALYLGGGQMIEAPQSGMHVRVTAVRYGDILPYATRLIG